MENNFGGRRIRQFVAVKNSDFIGQWKNSRIGTFLNGEIWVANSWIYWKDCKNNKSKQTTTTTTTTTTTKFEYNHVLVSGPANISILCSSKSFHNCHLNVYHSSARESRQPNLRSTASPLARHGAGQSNKWGRTINSFQSTTSYVGSAPTFSYDVSDNAHVTSISCGDIVLCTGRA